MSHLAPQPPAREGQGPADWRLRTPALPVVRVARMQ